MILPRHFAILQRVRPTRLRGLSILEDSYELVETEDREISRPLGVVNHLRGVGFGERIRRFGRGSYALELADGQTYQLIDTSTLVSFRWELSDPCGTLLGTATSSLLGLGYRIVLESASGELSRTRFKAWARSVEIRDRCQLLLAKIDPVWVSHGNRGLLRYRIELHGSAVKNSSMQLLVTAGALVKSKLQGRR